MYLDGAVDVSAGIDDSISEKNTYLDAPPSLGHQEATLPVSDGRCLDYSDRFSVKGQRWHSLFDGQSGCEQVDDAVGISTGISHRTTEEVTYEYTTLSSSNDSCCSCVGWEVPRQQR